MKTLCFTLYIDGMIVFDKIRMLRYNGEGESGFHLMSENMVGRVDPHPNALLYNLYGIYQHCMWVFSEKRRLQDIVCKGQNYYESHGK